MPDPDVYRGKRTPAKSRTSSAARGSATNTAATASACSAITSTAHRVDAASAPTAAQRICCRAGYALPMYRNPDLNLGGMPLEADHSMARSRGGLKADRLVLAAYNRSRGARDRGDRYAALWRAQEWTGGGQLAY